jgi:nucleoside-triphosphatase THEP1
VLKNSVPLSDCRVIGLLPLKIRSKAWETAFTVSDFRSTVQAYFGKKKRKKRKKKDYI